jgi:phospholipid/cholesterol/gamma-HCH transport system permease protein
MFEKFTKLDVLWRLILREIDDLIIGSLGIVSLISFFVGGVVAIQTAINMENPLLPRYLVGFATRQTMILEFAPTFISIIMAGKVGSFITSSIGTMRVTEQIDALEVMGINPLNYLVFPKIIALLFYPFVITVAMFIAIFGGFVAMSFAGVPSEAFISGIQMDFEPFHVSYAYIKTILFAFILATVPSYHGYYMKGGALEVGKASTLSFVWTSIIIIIVNFIITQLLLS